MESKTDVSYGIVPIRKEHGDWKVLLIHQFSKIGNNTYWVLPKGHSEAGESPLETATRELKEETGLEVARILPEPTFTSEYTFTFDGTQIKKTVIFFIGIIESAEVTLHPEEVKEAGWYPLETAVDRLDYEATKQLFREAKAYIEQNL